VPPGVERDQSHLVDFAEIRIHDFRNFTMTLAGSQLDHFMPPNATSTCMRTLAIGRIPRLRRSSCFGKLDHRYSVWMHCADHPTATGRGPVRST